MILSNCIGYITSNGRNVNDELERMWPSVRYFSSIYLQGQRKAMKNLGQDSHSLNLGPHKYESEVLTTQLWHLVNRTHLRSE